MWIYIRFSFIAIVITANLLFIVALRTSCDRIFYKRCECRWQQGRLRQQLGSKQLKLESLINPVKIIEHADE